MLVVNAGVAIPRAELSLRATRASGAGGQHVNKTASRVELEWSVRESRALSEPQRELLLARLTSRLSADGVLRVVASDTRSQARNRELAEQRLAELVRRALVVPRPRRVTRPSPAARAARLEAKRRQGEKKRGRRAPPEASD